MQNVPAPEALGGQDPPSEALTLPSRTAPCFCVVNCPIKSQPRKTWAPSSTPQWQSPESLFSLPLSLSFPPLFSAPQTSKPSLCGLGGAASPSGPASNKSCSSEFPEGFRCCVLQSQGQPGARPARRWPWWGSVRGARHS